tara:strand:+ start:1627 stop:1923 length:297 start_codon:yes stop_codon:yes gene_type:complete
MPQSHPIEVGSFVFNYHHGLLRFGVVQSKLTDSDDWAEFKVNWLEDHRYDESIAWTEKLRPEETGKIRKETYRADQLSPIDLDHVIKVAQSAWRLKNV